jgi:hypothetical protein
MHEVMKLPGPGAGIGFIVGPYMILCALIVWSYSRKAMVAFYVCAVSGTVQAYLGPIAGSDMLGPAVRPYMVIAALVLGIVVDVLAFGLRRSPEWKAYPVVAIVSTIIFLVVYWLIVFPNSPKGMVMAMPAAIMIVLSMAGAVLFGSVPPIIFVMVTGKEAPEDDDEDEDHFEPEDIRDTDEE